MYFNFLYFSQCKISNSYLNLTREEDLTSTPLLDVSGLESRVAFKRESPTSVTPNANSYDYHAAQLERFLEEYRSLQKQLTKMKETCDNLCQDHLQAVSPAASTVTPSTSNDDVLRNNPVSPNSNQSLEDSIDFRNFESELTKYLLAKSSPSPKTFTNNSGVFNNWICRLEKICVTVIITLAIVGSDAIVKRFIQSLNLRNFY